ncbi:adhesion G-protein coupled receptor D1-like [Amphiura filiformis]|uniref:adhesion G-protein coupled receptor D1-like n=1 Tax=Amphiura filiformis TaxID=82378 RepID=UPI003B21C052
MLHYLWLVVFMWMLMEGVHLFLKVNPSINWSIKLPICMPIAWGIPSIIAFTTLGAGISNYGENGICWLPLTNGLIYAFAGPVILITMVNVILLVIILHKFLGLKTNQDKSEKERIKAGVRAMLILTPLLGVTWIFGVLQLDQISGIVFSYFFDIANGLQVKVFLKQKTARGRVDNTNTTGVSG